MNYKRSKLRLSTDLFDILSEIVAQAAEFGFGGHAHAIVPNRNQHFCSKRSWPDIRVAENFQKYISCIPIFHRFLGRSFAASSFGGYSFQAFHQSGDRALQIPRGLRGKAKGDRTFD